MICGCSAIYWVKFEKNYRVLIDKLRRVGASYLIVSERKIGTRPFLQPPLNDKKKHKGLIKVHSIESPRKIILYKLE